MAAVWYIGRIPQYYGDDVVHEITLLNMETFEFSGRASVKRSKDGGKFRPFKMKTSSSVCYLNFVAKDFEEGVEYTFCLKRKGFPDFFFLVEKR